MQDGSAGGSVITQQEWVTAALTSLVAGGAVFGVPNRDPQATHQDESVQPPAHPRQGIEMWLLWMILGKA
jgi:hypothetical protein